MKKIMFFRPLLYMGGTEVAILNLLKVLSKCKDYEFYIGYSDNTSDAGLLEKLSKYSNIINVEENNVQVDILINCSPYKSSIDKLGKVKYRKSFLWFHYFGKYEEQVFCDSKYLESLDKVIVVSETQKNIMLKQPYDKYIYNKIDVIHNILNSREIKEKSSKLVDLDFSKTLNLVTISRLSIEKGFHRMLELANLIKMQGIDFKWYIIGSSYYPEIENEIKNMFKEYENNFVFLGIKHNPFRILRHCDYLVLLSDDETWGMTITEAKILGIPCIVTDFPAAYEQIQDMHNGIILPRYNTENYESRIDDIINNKYTLKQNLKGFKYDTEKIIEKWKEILN